MAGFNAYAPFKMKGHTLPGPNQKKSAAPKLKTFGIGESENPEAETPFSFNPGGFMGAAQGALGNIFKKKRTETAPTTGVAPHSHNPGDGSIEAPGGGDTAAGEQMAAAEGGAEEQAPWEAMSRGDWFKSSAKDKSSFMKGLTPDQRKSQMESLGIKNVAGSIFGQSPKRGFLGGLFG